MKAAYITIRIPFGDEADERDAISAGDSLAYLALAENPGEATPAGIFPAFVGSIDKVEMRDE